MLLRLGLCPWFSLSRLPTSECQQCAEVSRPGGKKKSKLRHLFTSSTSFSFPSEATVKIVFFLLASSTFHFCHFLLLIEWGCDLKRCKLIHWFAINYGYLEISSGKQKRSSLQIFMKWQNKLDSLYVFRKKRMNDLFSFFDWVIVYWLMITELWSVPRAWWY